MSEAQLPVKVYIGGVRGQRVGSRGKGITPTTTEAHRQAQAAMNSAG